MQLDLFNNSKEDYLFNKMQQIEGSLDRRTKSLFALYNEAISEIITMKDQLVELREASRIAHERAG